MKIKRGEITHAAIILRTGYVMHQNYVPSKSTSVRTLSNVDVTEVAFCVKTKELIDVWPPYGVYRLTVSVRNDRPNGKVVL